jgi:hypothetical protein
MSWLAFGNAMTGGLEAFQRARQDELRRELLAEESRRRDAEIAYRAQRDGVDDRRYADSLARQDRLDTRADAREQRADDRLAFGVAQEYGGDIEASLAGRLRATGLGSALRDRQVIAGAGLAAGVDRDSLAAAPALGDIPGMTPGTDTVTSVMKTPQQLALEQETQYRQDKQAREQAFQRELAAAPTDAAKWAIATKYGVADIKDPADVARQNRALDIQAANAALAREDRADTREARTDYQQEVLRGEARERAQRVLLAWQKQILETTNAMPTPEQEAAQWARLVANEPLLAGAVPQTAAPPPPTPSRFSGLFAKPAGATNERR